MLRLLTYMLPFTCLPAITCIREREKRLCNRSSFSVRGGVFVDERDFDQRAVTSSGRGRMYVQTVP